ncbi:DUF6207 family protein [Streptomyces sp. NBC_01589]
MTEPGVGVMEVAACDDRTLAVQELLAAQGFTAPPCSHRAPAGDHRRRPALRPRRHRAISIAFRTGWVSLEVQADQPRCGGRKARSARTSGGAGGTGACAGGSPLELHAFG